MMCILSVAVVKRTRDLNLSVSDSFEEFEAKLKLYQSSIFVQLYRRRSAKIGSSRTNRVISNKDLVCQEVKYTCIHGTETFRPDPVDLVLNQSLGMFCYGVCIFSINIFPLGLFYINTYHACSFFFFF